MMALLLLASGDIVLAKRVALVIGNDDYQDVVKLQKAANDAKAMGDALESVGFEVYRAKDVTRRNMNRQLQTFYSKLNPGDEALFFYAGHGIEIAGRNYLLPTDIPTATPGGEDFIKSEAVPVDRILDSIRKRGTRVAIMVLDACRDNPFPSEGTRSLGGTRGLARMPTAEGTFIMYSAGVGQTALDRLADDDPHPNSVFTRSLVPLIKNPAADWEDDRHLVHHVGAWEPGKAAQSKHARVSIQNKRFTLVNNEELYDLKTDPGEAENVIAEYPEVVEQLRKVYDQWWIRMQPGLVNEDAYQKPPAK